MDSKELEKIIESGALGKTLRSSDIPSLDLYLDQILTLVEESTENGLTKTMVNNYSKDGLIKPVKGKKYSKEHIVQMLIIYYMKGVLSISDIKRIFDGIYSDKSFGGDELIASYDRFIDAKEKESELCGDMIKRLTESIGLDIEKTEDLLIFLMSIVSMSDRLKSCALTLIESRFPEEEKNQKTEKTEKKKKKKTEDKKSSDE